MAGKTLNEISVVNKLNPFRNAENTIYVTRSIKDENKKEVAKEDVPLDSKEGRNYVRLMAAENLQVRGPNEKELVGLVRSIIARAEAKPSRSPENPVVKGTPLEEQKTIHLIDERPKALDISLNEKGKPMALLPDGTRVPLKSAAAKAVIFMFLSAEKKRDATEAEVNAYSMKLIYDELADSMTKEAGEQEADLMERTPIVAALLLEMGDWHFNPRKVGAEGEEEERNWMEGSETEIRSMLHTRATEFGLQTDNWPKEGGAFGKKLRSLKDHFRRNGVEMTFTRSGKGRKYIFTWLDGVVPGWIKELLEVDDPDDPDKEQDNETRSVETGGQLVAK